MRAICKNWSVERRGVAVFMLMQEGRGGGGGCSDRKNCREDSPGNEVT